MTLSVKSRPDIPTNEGAKVKSVSEVGVRIKVAEKATEVNIPSSGTGPESGGSVGVYVTYNGPIAPDERYYTHYGEKAVPGITI